jgi:ATP-dependent Lon protease
LNNNLDQFEHISNQTADSQGKVTLPIILMYGQVALPSIIMPMNITHTASQTNATYANEAQTTALAVYIDGAEDDLLPHLIAQDLFGTEVALIPFELAQVSETILLAEGRRRLKVLEIMQDGGRWMAHAEIMQTQDTEEISMKTARSEQVRELFEKVMQFNESMDEDIVQFILQNDDIEQFCYQVASMVGMEANDQQRLLETTSLNDMLEQIQFHLSLQIARHETHERINNRVQDKMAGEQRRVYLQEQLEAIQTELGSDDVFHGDLGKFQRAIQDANMPADIEEHAQEELKRLAQMPMMTPEATVVRTYLEWLTSLPWQKKTEDNLDLYHAEKVLDEAHYGLNKVKERILEHIAVRKMAQDNIKSPIICFVGPPGVGKTSIGRSIADALGREFVRVSLGGVRDEAEIRGHRRTYIGSLPGRIIQTMKRAGTINPVFMLDEIDKLSEDYRGDPASALLEVLDPEQNQEFIDHYLEVPFDLSQTLFIATANELYPLPEALEDRMEIIEFRAYTEEEKLEIARRFLLPKQLKAHGINDRGIQFQQEALMTIIRQYTMEAGVRNLEREIANVCRKITRLVAMEKNYPHRITPKLVEKYLGAPHIIPTRANREDSIGQVTGLVWTAGGGDIQNIEVSLLAGKGNLTMTGHLGDILQESAQTAMGYVRQRAEHFNIDQDDFDDYDTHIHLPEGAVPKDGPSAGVALACGIISVLTERPVYSRYAMTGEITLRGYILPVGGIKEKVLAARRHRITDVILPADNRKDLTDIPRKALKDLNIHFAETMDDVIDLILAPAPETRQRDIKRAQMDDDNETQDAQNDEQTLENDT